MKKDKNIEEELEELSPLLSKMKKEGQFNNFQVPIDFFEKLPDLVLSQLETEQSDIITQSKRQVTWWKELKNSVAFLFQPRYVVGFATVALLLIAGFYLNSDAMLKTTQTIALEDISLDEIDAYITKNSDDFQENLLEEEELVEIFRDDNYLNVEDGQLEDYFDDELLEDVDLNTLENLL